MEELSTVMAYCWRLSRLVSPNEASKAGLTHDGSVCEFIGDLATALADGVVFDFFDDEHYSEVFNQMKEDVN